MYTFYHLHTILHQYFPHDIPAVPMMSVPTTVSASNNINDNVEWNDVQIGNSLTHTVCWNITSVTTETGTTKEQWSRGIGSCIVTVRTFIKNYLGHTWSLYVIKTQQICFIIQLIFTFHLSMKTSYNPAFPIQTPHLRCGIQSIPCDSH